MLWGFSYIPSISEIFSIFLQCMLAGDKITLTSVKPPLEMKTIFVSSGLSSHPLSFSLVQEECNGNTNIYLVYISIQITFFFFPREVPHFPYGVLNSLLLEVPNLIHIFWQMRTTCNLMLLSHSTSQKKLFLSYSRVDFFPWWFWWV